MGIGGRAGRAIKFLTTCCFEPLGTCHCIGLGCHCRHAAGPSELKVFGFSATGIYVTRGAFVSSYRRISYVCPYVCMYIAMWYPGIMSRFLKSTACEEKQYYSLVPTTQTSTFQNIACPIWVMNGMGKKKEC